MNNHHHSPLRPIAAAVALGATLGAFEMLRDSNDGGAAAATILQRDAEVTGQVINRSITLDRQSITDTDDERSIDAALSSEAEVPRIFGREVLVHTAEAINLERAAGGLPMLFNHDTDQPIGLVQDVRIDAGRLRGRLVFSFNDTATRIWDDVKRGFLKDVSIRYRIDKWERESDSDLLRVTRWTIMEGSIVTVPADHTVGVGRDASAAPVELTREDNDGGDSGQVVQFQAAHRQGVAEGTEAGAKAERERIAAINRVFALPSVPRTGAFDALRDTAIERGYTAERTNAMILELMGDGATGATAEPGRDDARQIAQVRQGRDLDVTLGADERDKYRDAAVASLLVRSSVINDREAVRQVRESGLSGVSMLRMLERCMRFDGTDTLGMSDDQVVDAFFSRAGAGHTTSDFLNILSSTANKAMMIGWDAADENWDKIARRISAANFNQFDIVGLSSFSDLEEVTEDGEITYGTLSDLKETIQLLEFARKLRLTRRVIINDNLNMMAMAPFKIGRAANRRVGDTVWGQVTGNPTLNQDGTTLFHSDHNNLAGSGAAPSITTLDSGFAAVMKQKDPSNEDFVRGRPVQFWAPPDLWGSTNTLLGAVSSPGAPSTDAAAPNNYRGSLEPIIEPRLSDNSTTAWYLSKDPSLYDTLVVAFLNGVSEPYLREEIDPETRAIVLVGGIDVQAAAVDFRGVYKNPGA